jgi:signal transduction histidine kinase
MLRIVDDGRGFEPDKEREKALQSQHFGILGMQERAELIGGSIAIESNPISGTSIQILVPCHMNGNG